MHALVNARCWALFYVVSVLLLWSDCLFSSRNVHYVITDQIYCNFIVFDSSAKYTYRVYIMFLYLLSAVLYIWIKRLHKVSKNLSVSHGNMSACSASYKGECGCKKLKRDTDELKQRHFGPYSSGHHRQSHSPVTNTAACMSKGKGMSFWTPTVI